MVIDASRVHTMSSDGLRVLLEHAKRCEAAGGDLVVRNPSPVTARVFEICGLDQLTAVESDSHAEA
jgi:anti-anti-sigma factor